MGGEMPLAPGIVLRDVTLTPRSRVVGRAIRDAGLPPYVLIITIQRSGATLIPRGDSVLAAGDVLTLVATTAQIGATEAALRG
jgi:Trk K+ transport system NAD-binding subunit